MNFHADNIKIKSASIKRMIIYNSKKSQINKENEN